MGKHEIRQVIWLVAFLFLYAISFASAYESDMINLQLPTHLDANEGEIDIQHRFYGKINDDPVGTLLGTDLGANVGMGLKFMLTNNLYTGVYYVRDRKELLFDAGYTVEIGEILSAEPSIGLLSKREFGSDSREFAFQGTLAVSSSMMTDRIMPGLNLSIDSFGKRLGLGLGVLVKPIEKGWIAFEVYPVPDEKSKRYYTIGVGISTYGHHFIFSLSNGWQIGANRMSAGTNADGIYLGFNIRRLIER